MGILSNSPQGFSSAVESLNTLPQGLLAELCGDVMAFLQFRAGFISTEHYEISFSSLNPRPKVKEIINALTFVFRSAGVARVSADELVAQLKASLEWSDTVLAVLRHVWKEEGPALIAMPTHTLSVGQLLSMEWKLGVAMSSSTCRSLNAPYLTLQLRLGQENTHTLDMTLPEFQNFASQLKDMASTLETAT
ncbi:COMM domain-containing protein 6-like [Halichondria panicea]|uniref:COMM domain-containing protein 6-like n=1 Tax=Halichondria panicea TaxID=6063 RepID=UPI00312B9126